VMSHTPLHLALAIEERSLLYTAGLGLDTRQYEGFLVLPDSLSNHTVTTAGTGRNHEPPTRLLPGVLIAHQWMGLGATERTRARELAREGFVAFALDVYGVGCRDRPCGPETMAALNSDPEELRRRALSGLAQLTSVPGVDPRAIGANGYCFGGTTVLELARTGAALQGLVTFHGGLAPLDADSLLPPQDPSADSGSTMAVQIHTGDLDPITHNDLAPLVSELRAAGVTNWQTMVYGECAHGWTDPANGSYKAREGAEAHRTMLRFYADLFQRPLLQEAGAASAAAGVDHGIYSSASAGLPPASAARSPAGASGGPGWTATGIALAVGGVVGFAVGKQAADCGRRSQGYEKADLSEAAD
jgi:dienelactone hydrolase